MPDDPVVARNAGAVRRTREDGERTRAAILEEAVRLASVLGLDGLSLGRLASAIPMSKSGVYAHFGSKQQLQLAVVEATTTQFIEEVVSPALQHPLGRGRVLALCDEFLDHVERRMSLGGCFFVAAAAWLGPRSGVVHDVVAERQSAWDGFVEDTVRKAQQAGDIRPDVDSGQLAFELVATLAGTNTLAVIHDDVTTIERGRRCIRDKLAAASEPLTD